MKQFKVLDRTLDLYRHYLLEASAGTGKTFSIQHLVVRLLMTPPSEGPIPLLIDQILVVTFTRAAASELKIRIRSQIEEILKILNHWIETRTLSTEIPDYLCALIEQGQEAVELARKRLREALFGFDCSQIFTIHSFCAKMLKKSALEADFGLYARLNEDRGISVRQLKVIVESFFYTGVRSERYSPSQLERILKYDPDHSILLQAVAKPYPFSPHGIGVDFEESFCSFQKAMHRLKRELQLNSTKMMLDFEAQIEAYKKTEDSREEVLIKASRFTALFDQQEWSKHNFDSLIKDGLVFVEALNPALLKAKKTAPTPQYYPDLFKHLERDLLPIVTLARHPLRLLTRLARDCHQHLQHPRAEEELLSADDLLYKCSSALQESSFRHRIQALYRAAIIDEFQDTDPTQWSIFRNLFLNPQNEWQGCLYLVGDPKQSIYSFRQADIYTYLEAGCLLGSTSCYSLQTNYRSQPHLVAALNQLFTGDHLPHFIPLPKLGSSLACPPIQANPNSLQEPFQEERGAIHFIVADGRDQKKLRLHDAETKLFFPYFVQELKRLREVKKLELKAFACLVRDRHQAARLAAYLETCNIPYLNQRSTHLADSRMLQAFIDLIDSLQNVHDLGKLKRALASPIIGWEYPQLKSCEHLQLPLSLMRQLRITLQERGVVAFFEELMAMSWVADGRTVQEQLLGMDGGEHLYRDLQQMIAFLIERASSCWMTLSEMLFHLHEMPALAEDDEACTKRLTSQEEEGVQILTLHSSKGLEFEVVFALGLAQRSPTKSDRWIPIEEEHEIRLTPVDKADSLYLNHCEEHDAEKMRQFYVAMTRAKKQLYVPLLLYPPHQKLEKGEASPIDLFGAKLFEKNLNYLTLYAKMEQEGGEGLLHFLQQKATTPSITYSMEQISSIHAKYGVAHELELFKNGTPDLFPPKTVRVHHHPIDIHSFTSLTSSHSTHNPEEHRAPPYDFEAPLKNPHTLPAGIETGRLLHQLLEKIPFQEFESFQTHLDAIPLLRPFLHYTAFQAWEEAIAYLLFQGLSTDLKIGRTFFSLSQLERGTSYREMPFLYSNAQAASSDNSLTQGIIDLIFKQNDLYYIVDWKTNWLGESCAAYGAVSLKTVIQKQHYELQASFYQEALKRYLSLVDPRPFEECYGGTLYLFLRGMEQNSTNGIYLMSNSP